MSVVSVNQTGKKTFKVSEVAVIHLCNLVFPCKNADDSIKYKRIAVIPSVSVTADSNHVVLTIGGGGRGGGE